MTINSRTLGAAVFAVVLLMVSTGCGKKKAPITTAPPVTNNNPAGTETPPPPASLAPRINSFTVEPRSIERGQSATLRWSVANATEMGIDQSLGAISANGSRQVFPSNTTTYTLTARSAGGTDTRSVTVEVASPPPPPPPAPAATGNVSGGELLSREAQDAYFDY
ncbi:MAG TPA: hypothetical protein VKS01_02720, partial [Bryobacteraceae bacterium]|nr:hypothetical protein [Bryobacteraceae bacterium]